MTEPVARYAWSEVEWPTIPGRGRVAALTVRAPGLSVGDNVEIGGAVFEVREIEIPGVSILYPEPIIGQRVYLVLRPAFPPRPIPMSSLAGPQRMDYHRAADLIDALHRLAQEHGYALERAVEHLDEPRTPPRLRFTLSQQPQPSPAAPLTLTPPETVHTAQDPPNDP